MIPSLPGQSGLQILSEHPLEELSRPQLDFRRPALPQIGEV
jgi:hypothetical protein